MSQAIADYLDANSVVHAVAFGLQHNLQAFVFYKGPGGAAEEFSKVTNWVTVMKSVDYDVLTIIGDGILVGQATDIHDVLLSEHICVPDLSILYRVRLPHQACDSSNHPLGRLYR